MEFDLRHETGPCRLTVTVRGPLDFVQARTVVHAMCAEAAAREFPPILVDVLEVEADMSATELLELIGSATDTGLGSRSRVAIVGRTRGEFDRLGFLMELASHRGMQLQRFADTEPAEAWLHA